MAKNSTRKSFRLRFPFWLDLNKPDEADLAEKIATLKEERAFVKTIRDGIRLIWDLRAGRLDVLFFLFPWVKEEFDKRVNTQAVSALQDQLARLEVMMGQGMSIPVDAHPKQLEPQSSSPQPLRVPQLTAPVFDDDDQDTIIIKRNKSTDAAANLVHSWRSLQSN